MAQLRLFLALPLAVTLIACGSDDDDVTPDQRNVVQLAQGDAELSTLVEAVVAADLAAKFGADSLPLRAAAAFGGGVLMAFGARMAGGCTSGHGISGTLQLNVASWIAVIFFFIGGVILANLIFRA